jgi:hypothetical protein
MVRLQLTLDAEPMAHEFEAGLLSNDQYPNHRIIPTVKLQSALAGKDKTWDLVLKISGLIVFGDSTAPLLYNDRPIETLRFYKPGLTLKTPAEGPIIAREGQEMVLVLENPSEFDYKSVRARLRFRDFDVCAVSADQFGSDAQKTKGNCLAADQWEQISVPRTAQLSLRVKTPPEWFRDAATGFARSTLRKGILTLRFQGEEQGVFFEENLPLDVRFDPGVWSLTKSFILVGLWLVVGALLSLLLRVSIPNYRRKKSLKDELNEARKETAEISDQVDSQLRVLLRVERLALDQLRRDGFVLGPDFSDIAKRVSEGLTTLRRKIGYVQRLDAAMGRRETVLAERVSPTRLDIIDRNLGAACSALKSDQLSDLDWVFIQQRLEAADTALTEPTEEEKQAFEAMLIQRWKAIRDHFGLDPQTNELIVPGTLKAMEACFPDKLLLPKVTDPDGASWIKSVGVVRADLQLTALEIVQEVQFLAPALADAKWQNAMVQLTEWLETPAINNLTAARSLLLELAEGISAQDIVKALSDGQMRIESDPQFVNPNQTVRLGVLFRDPSLNRATARGAIECEWHFPEPSTTSILKGNWFRKAQADDIEAARLQSQNETKLQKQKECGWKIHRYFEAEIQEQMIETYFYHQGLPVKSGNDPVKCVRVATVRQLGRHRKDKWERWVWRPAPQALQLFAALLVPLAALAVTTAGEGASGRWWDLVGLGFGSETIRNILSGQNTSATSQNQTG